MIEYRVIHFVPDPFIGTRFAVGALVRDGTTITFEKAQHIPAAPCLGGDAVLATLEAILRDMDDASLTFATLPESIGPHASLDTTRQVPVGVRYPLAWVREHVLPRPSDVRTIPEPRAQRATEGFRFFETWGLAGYVRKQFRPPPTWTGLGHGAEALPPISHWVDGMNRLLLLEPIVLTRPSADAEVNDVARDFGMYRYALTKFNGSTPNLELLAYVLHGGSRQRRAEAIGRVAPFAHRVVDLASDPERKRFAEEIRSVGEQGTLV